MACRDALEMNTVNMTVQPGEAAGAQPAEAPISTDGVFFGVDSASRADTVLQNNLTEFAWAARNKIYPDFWGRFIGGENAVTADELSFIRKQGCKAAIIYNGSTWGQTSKEQQGVIDAKKAGMAASELGISAGTAIFLEVEPVSEVTAEYMKGFAQSLIQDGYTPGFRASTDANYGFDRQFCRGAIDTPEIFGQCLIWAVTPSLPEYFRTVNSHNIYPDSWTPFCPSCMTRDQIAIWQYGKECHPINDYSGHEVSFNVNLVKKPFVILEKMY